MDKSLLLEELRRIRKRVDVVEASDFTGGDSGEGFADGLAYLNGQHEQARNMLDGVVTLIKESLAGDQHDFKEWLHAYQTDREKHLDIGERTVALRAWEAAPRGLVWRTIASFVPEEEWDTIKNEEVLLWNPRYGVALGAIYGFREKKGSEVHYDSYGRAGGYHGVEWLMYALINKPDLPENYDPLGLMKK